MQENITQFTFHIKKRTPQQQLHLRRNIDQGQTVASREGLIADGRQRGRQEHFAQSRIEIEGELETKKKIKVNANIRELQIHIMYALRFI